MPDISSGLAAGLETEGLRVRQILPGSQVRALGSNRYEVDFSSAEQLRQLHQLLTGREGDYVGGVINLLGLTRPLADAGALDADIAYQAAFTLFQFFREFLGDLQESAQVGGGRIANVTAIDGQFGLQAEKPLALGATGTVGFCKSLQRENPELSVTNIDVEPAMPAPLTVARLIDELIRGDLLEVGLTAAGRFQITVHEESACHEPLSPLPLERGAVVLVTGGAYGITAQIALNLARHRPHLVIVGRSPRPADEDPETAHLNEAGLRTHFISLAKSSGQKATPAEIQRSIERVLKNRRIRANLEAFEKAGATLEYHSVDVRDESQFGGLIDDLYRRLGRIDGVLHGAGVIHDKRIRDKSPQNFEEVFRTKVDSALILSAKLRPESLKFLVFFSSVSGRFGNSGQCDYSAANEFLNKLAIKLDRSWPGQVVAINWGPWDAGMVSDELRRIYESKGVYLIPVDEGVRCLETELQTRRRRPEIVISCSVEQIASIGLAQ